ncbi:hypothetical protein Anapl_15512 [Anas platyrhynchos]|uniref:Uncharacterized protein n=1 Tax=Anas platyrhynchos TaxID=8839 RepID=R0L2G8_ANAPL|nr:hypothetical protein Anapl_15512 [Anas platyrhynchos]
MGRMLMSALHILILGPCAVLWGHRVSSVLCPSLGNISQLLAMLDPVDPCAGCSLQLLIQLRRSLLPCFNLLLNQTQDSQILALASLPPLPLIATSPLLPSFVPCFGPLDLFSHPAVVLYEESVSCTSVGHQPKAKPPKTLLQKHRRAVAAMEGKGVVCVCRMWDFMEGGSLCLLASKTPFLGEGNSRFISMDALFLHVGSAVLLCQSPRYSRCESGRADDAGRGTGRGLKTSDVITQLLTADFFLRRLIQIPRYLAKCSLKTWSWDADTSSVYESVIYKHRALRSYSNLMCLLRISSC